MTAASSPRVSRVKDLLIEWEGYAPTGGRPPQGRDVLANAIRGTGRTVEAVLPCSNSRCGAGGFEIGFVVESMASEGVHERAGVLVCVGWERPSGSAGERMPCTSAIRYRVRVAYATPVDRGAGPPEDGNGGTQ